MRPVLKGVTAAAVLILAAAVALVPRWQDEPDESQGPSFDPEVLASARDAADLPSCPRPGNGHEPVAELEGVTVTCSAGGGDVSLGKALAGKTTLVNIWATWCQPCRDELPAIDAYSDSAGAVNVLGVQVASGLVGGLRMLAELDVRIPVVHGSAGGLGPVRKALEVPPTLPASYVVSPDGTVRLIEQPRVFHSPEQVREAVQRYSEPSGGGDG